MEKLFAGIPLAQMNTSMTINATAPWLLALYIACAEKQGASRRELTGTVQNDIVKEYLSRGTYIFPPQPSLRLITDVIAFAYREVPQWNPTNGARSEEHTSELQSLMRISYAVFCLKQKKTNTKKTNKNPH